MLCVIPSNSRRVSPNKDKNDHKTDDRIRGRPHDAGDDVGRHLGRRTRIARVSHIAAHAVTQPIAVRLERGHRTVRAATERVLALACLAVKDDL